MKCAEDYFSLVGQRLGIQFVRAINMLDTSCDNTRKTTGNGRFIIFITGVYVPGYWRPFTSFNTKVKIFLESEDKPPVFESKTIMNSKDPLWFQIEETFRSQLTNKETEIIICVYDNDNV